MTLDEKRLQIVEAARTYLGTKFKHQGRLKDFGIDCAGLVIGVGKELGYMPNEWDHVAYGHLPHAQMMANQCDLVLDRILIEEATVGDIYLMAFQSEPQHLCIITDKGIIHSYAQVRRCVEHGIDDIWLSRVKRAYRYKGLMDG